VLLLTFGSLAAAALPMVIGLSALVIGLGVVGAVSFWLPMSDFVTNASSMIGIALGVDYTMFLLQRFREVSAEESSPRAAIRRTMRTTGRAVAWSGVTVMLAESTLFLVHSRSIRSAALGMVVVTASALVAALTIVPVSFELFGPRLLRSPLRLSSVAHRRRVANASGSGWGRWAAYVTRRAPLMLAGGLALLAVLAIPSAHLPHSVNISAASTLPASSSTRQAYAAVETTYGPDAESPVVVVVQAPTGSRNVGGASTAAHAAGSVPSAAGAATLARTVAADGDVLSTSVAPLTAGRSAVVITTRTGPYSSATRNLVQSLRSGTLHHQLSGIAYLTGGETAMSVDATSAMFGGLAKVAVALALVIGAMLLLVFRTWWLPLKAVLLVAISLAASLGGLLAMTGSSLGSALIGAPGAEALHPIVPVTIVAIVVALSTDYEVMLITRMAETWRRQRDNQAAIVDGMAHTGGVITSAAAVMIAVFVGFAVAELQPLKQLGVGLALAVFIDATVVRGVLVPAAMALMGRWNWPPLRRRPAAVAGSGLHFGSPVRSLPS
jgi:RND superfamily putative drug exporter